MSAYFSALVVRLLVDFEIFDCYQAAGMIAKFRMR